MSRSLRSEGIWKILSNDYNHEVQLEVKPSPSTAFHEWACQLKNLRSFYPRAPFKDQLTLCRILEVSPPKVGFDHPAYVRAEVTLDVSNLADYVVREWDSLRPDDVVYLLAVQPQDGPSVGVDGQPIHVNRMFGLLYLRTAEIVQILDENGRSIRAMHDQQTNGYAHRPRLRRLLVNVDAISYLKDEGRKSKGKQDVYESINLIVRRKGRENNFKKILESIQSLILSDVHVPDWLQEVFLGYGDPAGATYTRLPNRLNRVDFRDTFLDWQHLTDSLHGKVGTGIERMNRVILLTS